MPWQLIDPAYYARHIARSDPPDGANGASAGDGGRALWYQDTGRLDTGELVLQTDNRGRLLWFQLSHTAWPRGREHVAEWRLGGALHVGEVDGGEQSRFRNASPTIRRLAHPPRAVYSELIDYFLHNAGVLDEQHREAIAGVLWDAMQAAPWSATRDAT